MSINDFIENVCVMDEDNENVYYDFTSDKEYYFNNEKIIFFGFDDSQDYCRIKTEADLYSIKEFWEHPYLFQII